MPLTGHTDAITAITTITMDGKPRAITAGLDGTVRIWDPITSGPVGDPLSNDARPITAITATPVHGQPHAIIGSIDRSVRVWNLTTGQQIGPELAFPIAVHALTVTLDGHVAVGFGHETALLTLN